MCWIFSPKKQVADVKQFTEMSELHKGKKWSEYSPEFKIKFIISCPECYFYCGHLLVYSQVNGFCLSCYYCSIF